MQTSNTKRNIMNVGSLQQVVRPTTFPKQYELFDETGVLTHLTVNNLQEFEDTIKEAWDNWQGLKEI